MDTHNFTLDDLVGRDRIIWEWTPDYRIDLVRRSDGIHIETYYLSLDAVFAENAEAAADFNETGRLSDLERAANIPVGLYHEWKKEGIIDDPDRLKRRLNDGDYAKVRTNNLVL